MVPQAKLRSAIPCSREMFESDAGVSPVLFSALLDMYMIIKINK
jgi:hypothetical protein